MAGRVIEPEVVPGLVSVIGGTSTLLVSHMRPYVLPDSVEPSHSWFHTSIAVVVTGGGVMVVTVLLAPTVEMGAPLMVMVVGQRSSRVIVAGGILMVVVVDKTIGGKMKVHGG
jgi:hypothetical protein